MPKSRSSPATSAVDSVRSPAANARIAPGGRGRGSGHPRRRWLSSSLATSATCSASRSTWGRNGATASTRGLGCRRAALAAGNSGSDGPARSTTISRPQVEGRHRQESRPCLRSVPALRRFAAFVARRPAGGLAGSGGERIETRPRQPRRRSQQRRRRRAGLRTGSARIVATSGLPQQENGTKKPGGGVVDTRFGWCYDRMGRSPFPTVGTVGNLRSKGRRERASYRKSTT